MADPNQLRKSASLDPPVYTFLQYSLNLVSLAINYLTPVNRNFYNFP